MNEVKQNPITQDRIANRQIFSVVGMLFVLTIVTTVCNFILNYNLTSGESVWYFTLTFSIGLFIFSSVLLIPAFLFILVVTNSLVATSLVLIFASTITTFINSNKLMFRNEPMYPQDVSFIFSIDDLVLMLSPEQRVRIYALAIVLIVSIILVIVLHRQYNILFFRKTRKNYVVRVLMALILIVVNVYIFNFNNGTNLVAQTARSLGFYDARWDQKNLYDENGFILGFVNNFPGQAMNKPLNYNRYHVDKVMSEYSLIADQINLSRQNEVFDDVSIVYILSESFSDPNMVNGIELNSSPVDYVINPSDKAYFGNVIVPSYGGGTPNSEFEILTGMTVQHLLPNMSLPYQDFMTSYKSFPSIISEFKKNDSNKAISLHSYTSEMYKRPSVYSILGFDEQIYEDDMSNLEVVRDSFYISDQSIYTEIIEILEHREESLFVHAVTMQNHTPYNDRFNESNFEILSSKGKRDDEIINFSHGIAMTDLETKSLIDTISVMDENIIVVFYGDHLPGIYEEYSDLNNDLDFARTPYFVYSNFSSPSYNFSGDQSLTLMNNLVKDLANVKVTPFEALTLELRLNIPSGRYDEYLNNLDEIHEYDTLELEQKKLISDFKLIQYDIISGKKYSLQ